MAYFIRAPRAFDALQPCCCSIRRIGCPGTRHEAALRFAVDQGVTEPIPLAIPDFLGNAQANRDIAGVVRADLERSGLFKSLPPASFIEKISDINTPPHFADWRTIQAQGLVTGQATMQTDGRLKVEFRLWDIFGESQMVGLQYMTTPENWRRIAHLVSDAIYERITGEKGYFDTRIVFISESGPKLNRRKRLAVMDQDGANPVFLTQGDYLVLTPRFNPTAQMIAYMSYIQSRPRVYLFDLETGRQEMLGNFPNMTFSPRFSPDGKNVVMALETNGNSDIYLMDLATRAVKRLTNDPGIDTAPSFSPDGKQIAFESSRGGSQQIYVMNADGTNVHRISFGAGKERHTGLEPTRRSDRVHQNNTGLLWHLRDAAGWDQGERQLTHGWQDEGPTWAPNGPGTDVHPHAGNRTERSWRRFANLVDRYYGEEMSAAYSRPAMHPDPAWSPLIQ